MGLGESILGLVAKGMGWWKSSGLKKAQDAKTDAMRARDLASSQRAMLGEFSSQPPEWLQRCLVQAKAARRAQRLDLINRAVGSCPDHVDTATRLRGDMDEVENMRCAKAVYGARDGAPVPIPPGFKAPSEEDLAGMGLTQDMLTPKGTQFTAAVYMKDPAVWGPSPEPAAVVAFRGSTVAGEDWKNNFAQGLNAESDYYRSAVEIGTALSGNGASAQIVGHSLGGGLASAAQGASGLPASTYNAAGLHPDTVARYAGQGMAAQADQINAIRVQGEVLTKTQEEGMLSRFMHDAVGKKTDIAPATNEKAFDAMKKAGQIGEGEDYETFLHGMDEVIGSMEARKTADESALKACVQGGS